MKLTFRASRRILAGSALMVAAALLPGTALASTAAPTGPGWWAPRCTSSQTKVTLGRGDAAAGTVFYPLRFTNISNRTCGMIGYPKTYAQYQDGKVIGNASRKIRGSQWWHALAPGATVHSTLGLIEAGNICAKPVWAASMRIYAPHQRDAFLLRARFQACHGNVTVMTVTPVAAGRG